MQKFFLHTQVLYNIFFFFGGGGGWGGGVCVCAALLQVWESFAVRLQYSVLLSWNGITGMDFNIAVRCVCVASSGRVD